MEPWRVRDVMTVAVATVPPDCGYKQVADLLVQRRISAVPVVDADRVVLGVVSEADLLAKLNYPDRVPTHPLMSRRRRESSRRALGDTARDLMTSPAVTVGADEPIARAARVMEAARVKRLPVVDRTGRLLGIVSRRDLIRLYVRPDNEIRFDVTDEVRDLGIDLTRLHIQVSAGVVTLSGRLDHVPPALLIRAVRSVAGVVDVIDDIDDGEPRNHSWRQPFPIAAGHSDRTS
jgi:CBS-domain-containing membrane protein